MKNQNLPGKTETPNRGCLQRLVRRRLRNFEFYNIQLEWKPQDMWIGLFWKRTGGTIDAWLCIVPMLPIHASWRWSQVFDQ